MSLPCVVCSSHCESKVPQTHLFTLVVFYIALKVERILLTSESKKMCSAQSQFGDQIRQLSVQ